MQKLPEQYRAPEKDTKILFVVKKYEPEAIQKTSEEFQLAFMTYKAHCDDVNEHLAVVEESVVLKFPPDAIEKRNVFVLDVFEGPCFDFLLPTKAIILGPMCLTTSIVNGLQIPNTGNPVFCNAMRDYVISVSGLKQPEKNKIQRIVQFMGAKFRDDLDKNNTHLVSNTVLSKKYEVAAEKKLKIYHNSWIEAVWKEAIHRAVMGNDEVFDEHKLPPFYGLTICSTNFDVNTRTELKTLVESNGGTYSGSFKSHATDILILERSSTDSVKFKSAQTYKKECLTPDWIRQSVVAGYAIAMDAFRVSNMRASTPEKGVKPSAADFGADATQMSIIPNDNSIVSKCLSTVNESVARSVRSVGRQRAVEVKYKKYLDKIDFAQMKKAGSFLDGCNIYLSGFKPEDKEKLMKLLNSGSATRYDELTDHVTHVVVGEHASSDFEAMKKRKITPNVVTLEWISESFRRKEAVDEESFKYVFESDKTAEAEMPSPASKKAIESFNSTFKRPKVPPKFNIGQAKPENHQQPGPSNAPDIAPLDDGKDDDLMNQYLTVQEVVSLPHHSETEVDTEALSNLTFFYGMTVYCYAFEDEEEHKQLVTDCKLAKAEIISSKKYKHVVDYVITPVKVKSLDIPVRYKHVVSDLWLEAAIRENTCLDIKYWHHPVVYPDDNVRPLQNHNVCISTYGGQERMFCVAISELLGATPQENYLKKLRPILVCPLPEGPKYEAAKKWGLPAVTKDWLMQCLQEKRKVPLEPYMVGIQRAQSPEIKAQDVSEMAVNPMVPALAPSTTTDHIELESVSNAIDLNLSQKLREVGAEVAALSQGTGAKKQDEEYSLHHRRLSELRAYTTPTNSPGSPGANISRNVNDLSCPTPVREAVKNALKEAYYKDSPNTRRTKRLMETPRTSKVDESDEGTPEFVRELLKTPGMEYDIGNGGASPNTRGIFKRRLEVLDTFYRPVPKDDGPPETPPEELKKRYRRDFLGWTDEDERRREEKLRGNGLFSTPVRQSDLQQDSEGAAVAGFTEIEKLMSSASKSLPELPDTEKHDVFRQTEEQNGLGIIWKQKTEIGTKTKKFIYTSVDEQTRTRLMKIVEDLNGQNIVVSDVNGTRFDPDCTHIICGKPNRGEKTMAGLAAGRWILSTEYLEASAKAKRFLNEQDYEWGNQQFQHQMQLSDVESQIAAAACRWRQQIETTKQLAFVEIKCIIANSNRRDAFSRIISAGGGEVVDIQSPYGQNLDKLRGVTHCLVEGKSLDPNDKKHLQNAGIPILSINFINHFLTSTNPNDSIEKYKIL